MKEGMWEFGAAKSRFSDVIEMARTSGPQKITRNDVVIAVVVSAEEWVNLTKRKGSLAEFLLASPLRNSGLQVERPGDSLRKINP